MSHSEEFSRPATLEDLKQVLSSLNKHNVPYLLIGGYALFSHGYHRATDDIDLLLPATQEAGKSLINALLVLPDKASSGIDPKWFEEGENIRLADEVVVDLIFQTCGETYESLQSYSETINLDGIPVKTLNLEGLLKTKQSLRDKDMIDRTVLGRALTAMRNK